MAKLDLTKLINQKKRIRIGSIICLIGLIYCIASLSITKNPKSSIADTNGGTTGVEGLEIQKILEPVQRPSGTANASFNPYALQKDDVIRVNIVVVNMPIGGTIEIDDDILKLPNGAKSCQPTNLTGISTPISDSGLYDSIAKRVVWIGITDSDKDGQEIVVYYCKVQ